MRLSSTERMGRVRGQARRRGRGMMIEQNEAVEQHHQESGDERNIRFTVDARMKKDKEMGKEDEGEEGNQ
eukprot:4763717-Pyramimonas_sp.AAC.1